jgi:hypothetical protein
MTTLTITPRGSTKIQKIDVPSWDAVLTAPDSSGTVEMAASGANVLIRSAARTPTRVTSSLFTTETTER